MKSLQIFASILAVVSSQNIYTIDLQGSNPFRVASDSSNPILALFVSQDSPGYTGPSTKYVFVAGSGDTGKFSQGGLFLTLNPTSGSVPQNITLTDGSGAGVSTTFALIQGTTNNVTAPDHDLYVCAFGSTLNFASLPSTIANTAPECSFIDNTQLLATLAGVQSATSEVGSTMILPTSKTATTAVVETTATTKTKSEAAMTSVGPATTTTSVVGPVVTVPTPAPTPSLISYIIHAGSGTVGNVNMNAVILPGTNGAVVVNFLPGGAVFVPASGLYLGLNLTQSGPAVFLSSPPTGAAQLSVTLGPLAKRQLSGTLTVRNSNGVIVNAFSCPSSTTSPSLSFSTATTLAGCTAVTLTATQTTSTSGAVVVDNNICINIAGVQVCNNQTIDSVGGNVNLTSTTDIVIGCTDIGTCSPVSSLAEVCPECAAFNCSGTNGLVSLTPANAAASSVVATASASGSGANAVANVAVSNGGSNAFASAGPGVANAVANASMNAKPGVANAIGSVSPGSPSVSSSNAMPNVVIPGSAAAVGRTNATAASFTGDAVTSSLSMLSNVAGFLSFVGTLLVIY